MQEERGTEAGRGVAVPLSLRTVVTGGAGFIGSHLVDALVNAGSTVSVLDDLSAGSLANLAAVSGKVRFVEGDIRDASTVASLVAGADVVFHLAARGSVPRSLADPVGTFDVNVQGTLTVLDACRRAGVRRVVYASSSSVYGDSQVLPKREGEEGRPLSPYALSKAVNESTAALFSRAYGTEALGLRFFNVFGPRQRPDGPYAAVIPRFVRAALAGQPLVIFGDGLQSRDFTYVADVVTALLLAATVEPAPAALAWNVAAGRRTTLLELAETVRGLCGGRSPVVHEPPRAGDVLHSLADLGRIRADLGFAASWMLEAGLGATVAATRDAADRAR